MVPARRPRCDVSGAVAQLADDLLNPPSGAANAAAALDHLRLRLHASDALVWLSDGARAWRALHAGTTADSNEAVVVDLEDGAAIVHRLRHGGTLVRRAGEVSGLEHLLPPGVRSFVAAAAVKHETIVAVLIVGWRQNAPLCEAADVRYLRVGAALFGSAFDHAAPARDPLPEAVLASIGGRVAVLDRNGIVIAVNSAWSDGGSRHALAAPGGDTAGVSYVEICRAAATAGWADARSALEGIEAVRTGAADAFDASYPCNGDQERWCHLSVRPLRRCEGGVVIELTDLTQSTVADLARRMSHARFEAFADTLPLPVWVSTTDGRVVYGNERWAEAGASHAPEDDEHWTARVHPDDRERAAAAFALAAARGEGFEVEIRVRAVGGTYRWSVCSATPQHLSDGSVQVFVGACWDATAKHRAEAAFTQVAGKLVAAQEAERGRIARELHDDVGQQVAVLASRLDGMVQSYRPRSADLRAALAHARATAQEIAATVHALSHRLHPAKLRLLGLVQTLDGLCRDEASSSGIEIRFSARDVPASLPEPITLCLFRVSQEAIRNALAHSGATVIDVHLQGAADTLTLRVTDNGRGFDPLASQASGLGLLTMRERVELVGGTLAVEAAQPTGTTIRADVPLSAPRADRHHRQSSGSQDAVTA
jgi:PAS domain S-box-containing protein